MKCAAHLAALGDALASIVFPAHCPACGAYVEVRGGWCAACLSRTVRPHRLAVAAEACAALDGAWAVGSYAGALGTLIRDLKYRGRRGTLPYLHAVLLAAHLPQEIVSADLAVCVPLHEERQTERGFNQAELIFAAWLKAQGISLAACLVRSRATAPQYGLGERARAENVRGAFSLAAAGNGGIPLAGKRILLLDDILTTGATLTACAAVLRRAGAASVYALALASDRS